MADANAQGPTSPRADGPDRSAFVERRIDELFRTWTPRVAFIGAGLFLALALLDRVAAPHLATSFLRYRIAVSLALLAVGALFGRIRPIGACYAVTLAVIAVSAATIEAMILSFGGHRSSYYPGMLLLVGSIILLPGRFGFHAAAVALVYGIYLAPLLVLERITDFAAFFTANYFLVAILATMLGMRFVGHRLLVADLGRQFDLERERRRGERGFHDFMDNLPGLAAVHDREGTLVYANEAYRSQALRDGAPPPAPGIAASAEEVRAVLDDGRRIEREFTLPDAGGERHWLGARFPLADEQGRTALVGTLALDVTERRRVEELLRLSQQDWESTFDAITDLITIHDADYTITRANRAAIERLGLRNPMLGREKCHRCYHGTPAPPASCASCDALLSGEPTVSEFYEPHLGADVEVRAIPRRRGDGTVAGLVHIVRDITERKRAEEEQARLQAQLQQAQKMESVGRLAGGIAHDFNNILSAILGYSELVSAQLPGESPLREKVRVISESAERAAALTRQLLAFSRRQVLKMEPVDLDAVVTGLSRMLERIIGEDVHLEITTAGNLPAVLADARQVEQVLLNLAVNARDAMPAGGRLGIATAVVETTAPEGPRADEMPAGTYARIAVTDTGAGMAPGIVERIFEPFFTTKELGKGTGLGLATVYGIVKQHRGFIRVQSAPGAGSAFFIWFPATPAATAVAPSPAAEPLPRGAEALLVVDDDPVVRALVAEVLRPLGYEVREAGSAEDALRLVESGGRPVDLLLTDVVMPGTGGQELARQVAARLPRVRTLFMSGYPGGALEGQAAAEISDLVQKPMSVRALALAIRAALDAPRRD